MIFLISANIIVSLCFQEEGEKAFREWIAAKLVKLDEADGGGCLLNFNAFDDMHIQTKQRAKKVPNYLTLPERAKEVREEEVCHAILRMHTAP